MLQTRYDRSVTYGPKAMPMSSKQEAYSCNALGAQPVMRDDLAAPMGGRVFFAGEATMRHDFSSAHGGFLSGQRAANQVLQAYSH